MRKYFLPKLKCLLCSQVTVGNFFIQNFDQQTSEALHGSNRFFNVPIVTT